MMCFCSNCGQEANGKFCTNCGAPIEGKKDEHIAALNGINVDTVQLVSTYKNNRINAIKHVKHLTGSSLTESKQFVDSIYKDAEILGKAKAEQEKCEQEFKRQGEDYGQQGIPYCPQCHSTHLSANKKGFSLGQATVGWVFVGLIGLVGGMFGRNTIKITCLNCGNKFNIQKK